MSNVANYSEQATTVFRFPLLVCMNSLLLLSTTARDSIVSLNRSNFPSVITLTVNTTYRKLA